MTSLLETLQTRQSVPASQLTEPAPNDEQLEEILKCAITAPDHAKLSPWRFIVIRDEARHALAEVFVKAAKLREPDISEQKAGTFGRKTPPLPAYRCHCNNAKPGTPQDSRN